MVKMVSSNLTLFSPVFTVTLYSLCATTQAAVLWNRSSPAKYIRHFHCVQQSLVLFSGSHGAD